MQHPLPPGPWSANEEYTNCITINDAAGGLVASVSADGNDIVPPMREVAGLLAAAPDMLAALRSVVAMFQDSTRDPNWTALSKARAAIAKAEGK